MKATRSISQRITQLKLALTILLLLLCRLTNAQSNDYTIGVYDSLHSGVFNETRKILVHVPPGSKSSQVRYPVLYLLDGESHFLKTIGILDFLSNTTGNELCPKMIVVAIYSPDRDKDLTPLYTTVWLQKKINFLNFLSRNLFHL